MLRYAYRHLRLDNTAPPGATAIVVRNASGAVVARCSLGSLAPPGEEPLYRWGFGFDGHLWPHAAVAWTPEKKLDLALTRAEEYGCEFFVLGGDTLNTGFYREQTVDGVTTYYVDEGQAAKLAEIRDAHNVVLYLIGGNHESYYGKPLENSLALWAKYTGQTELHFAVERGNDLYVYIGQPRDTTPMSDAALQWLYETLEANRGKRVFVFVHSHLPGDSGNPLDFRDNSIFGYWGTVKTGVFKRLLEHYGVALLLHGHTHADPYGQELDSDGILTRKNSFYSLHGFGLGAPRHVFSDGTWEARDAESYIGIVDVHESCVVVRCIDNITGLPVPIGTYLIPTPIKAVAAGTFVDPTGTIVT